MGSVGSKTKKRAPLHRRWLALLLAALLAACAAPADPAPTPAAPAAPAAPVTFGALAAEQQSYAPLIEAFNAQNPDVRVQFVALDEFTRAGQGETNDAAAITRRVASAADTAALSALPPDAVTNGYVANLKPLIDADATFARADYYPHALDSPTGDDGVYLLPRTLPIALLAYNKELWALQKLPAPHPGWTWRDLLADAAQLAQKRGDEVDIYGLLDWDNGFAALASDLAARNVPLLGAPTSADPPRLDTPEVAAALAQAAARAQSGAVYSGKPADPRTLISAGRAALWRPELLPTNSSPPRFAVGTATVPPLPVALAALPTPGYVMSSGTPQTSAAWRWLAFLSRQEVKPPFGAATGARALPARISLAERSGYWSSLDAEATAAIKATLERAPPAPATTYDRLIIGPLRAALAAALGGKQPRDALREAQTALDKARAASQRAPTAAPERDPPIVATPARAAEGATTITFRTLGQDASVFQRAARAFNARTPDVFVQVTGGDAAGQTMKFKDRAASADCFGWWGPPPAEDADAALDLQPLIDADATFARDDTPPALLAPFRRGSALYGLPHELRLRVLVYNQTLFEAAKLAPPTAQWTLDDLRNAAQKLTRGSGATAQFGYAVPGAQTKDLLLFLARSGAAPTVGSGAQVRPNFSDPGVGLALRAYLDLLRSSSPHARLAGYDRNAAPDAQAFTLVQQGRVGLWFDESGAALFANSRAAPGFTLGIAPPPLGGLPLTPDDWSATGLYIAAKTPRAQACWAWLKYLSSDLTTLQQGFPARRSVAESAAFSASAAPGAAAVYRAYRAALARPDPSAAPEAFAQARVDFYWLFRAVDRALQGKDLDRELATAQDTTTRFLACLQGGGKGGECARQVDPNYSGLRGED